jgi:pimeloyl-ACP methyl ester carboxylesterase
MIKILSGRDIVPRQHALTQERTTFVSTETRLNARPATTGASGEPFTTHTMTSRDGTTIAYRQLGRGPGLVIFHGAMETGLSHLQLAEALADNFTVYLPDRRGRGLSGSIGPRYGMRREVEDVDALLTATGAHEVMGVSAGALIALRAALELPAIRRAAIFEPPLSINGSVDMRWLPLLDRDLAQGKLDAALVTGMLGAQMGPPIFQRIPRGLLEFLTRQMMASEQKKAKPGAVTMAALAPTLRDDFQLVGEMADTLEDYRAIPAEVLLLGGSKSPAYLRTAVDALAQALPGARRVTFAGLNHSATGPREQGGKPELVAQTLHSFFAA